jgi:transcriptional regulator with XRE-family HTH domain
VIDLTNDRELGPLIRRLRHDAGLSLVQLAKRVHLSKGGQSKREIDSRAMTAGALIETAHALGYRVVLQPAVTPAAHPARLASGETT